MKNLIRTLLKGFILVLIVQSNIAAQPTLAAGGKSDGTILGCAVFCDHSLIVEIPLANLDLYEPSGTLTHEFFPSNHPEMHLEVEIEGIIWRTPVEEFEYDYTTTRGINIYVASIEVPVDVCQICENQGVGIHDLDIDMRLKTKSNGTYFPYPACNHISVSDIFSCDFTYVPCGSNSCNNSLLTEASDIISVECATQCANGGNGLRVFDDNAGVLELQIVENPVQETLILESPELIKNGKLQIFNSKGQVILSQTQVTVVGKFNLDLSDIKTGIYYLHFLHNGHSTTKKFVKL